MFVVPTPVRPLADLVRSVFGDGGTIRSIQPNRKSADSSREGGVDYIASLVRGNVFIAKAGLVDK